MKIALVHDYLNEYGGAERVLEALSEIWPEAPIYTAFCVPGSSAGNAFTGKKIITSWMQRIPGYQKLHSPLRFLIPWIWGSFDFSGYDLVITSASWYVTKGVNWGKGEKGVEICYCHTPPRWLYGFTNSVNFQRWWIVRVYGLVVGHFLRMYDFKQAQKPDIFVANSKNVESRIRKFYRRESIVIYPPVEMPKIKPVIKGDNYLMVSRLVGSKGIELAKEVIGKAGGKLIIAGEETGWAKLKDVESIGRVDEPTKAKLMAEARGFMALSKDEDFGITPVEAMMMGTPVIAFNGGGYRETVIDGVNGVLFDDYSVSGLTKAMERFNKLKWDKKTIKKSVEKFSKERFKKEMREIVKKYA